jgi:hypothetical protein
VHTAAFLQRPAHLPLDGIELVPSSGGALQDSVLPDELPHAGGRVAGSVIDEEYYLPHSVPLLISVEVGEMTFEPLLLLFSYQLKMKP